MVSSVKLPILKKDEKDEAGNEVEVLHVTAQQILAMTRERKAKSTLIMVIPDEHLARFHGIKDAKTLWAAIKTRFGEGLDKGYDRFQRLPSLLEIHGAESTNNTNKLSAAYSVSTATGHSSQAQSSSSYVAILSMMVKHFYKKTRRKLEFNRKEPVGFDKTKVECFNCHRRGHFVRDCRTTKNSVNRSRDAGNDGYRRRDNGKRPAREEDEKALVVQDELGTYDWSYQVEEEATDFALMAFTSNPSSSSSSNIEVQSYSKKLVQSYEQLNNLFDEQREKLRKSNLEIVGFNSQFNEKEVLDVKEKKVTETMFDNHSSDEENSLANDRVKKGKGYHAVLPLLTWNYMPPKSNLSFAGLDDSIYKFKISETVTSLTKDEKDALETSTAFVEKTREVRTSASLIQDWDTDSDNDSVFRPTYIPSKIDFVKVGESVKPIIFVKHVKPVKPIKAVKQIKKSKNFSSSLTLDRKIGMRK
nr:hypothetical protein [Tanacetum cinerariifolium]